MIDVLLPHLELRPFIRGYIHNVIDFSLENLNNTYFFTPTHKKFIMLYLGSSVEVTFENKKKEKKKDMLIIGPQTTPVSLCFESNHRMIAIELQNIGQYYLLGGCPIHTLIDSHLEGDAVFGNPVKELIDKLIETNDLEIIKKELDQFFLKILNRNKLKTNRSDMLLNELPQNIPIAAMALAAGKSIRQLERLFKDRIGVSPNFFRKLRRFAIAYKIKELNPNQTWTQIAYSCGYFDQMHLIKDFKTFLGHNPSYINQMLNQQYQEYTNYQIPQ